MKPAIQQRLWCLLCLWLVISLACSLPSSKKKTSQAPTQPPGQVEATRVPPPSGDQQQPTQPDQAKPSPFPTIVPPPEVYLRPFASYPSIKVAMPVKYNVSEGYTLPLDLSKVKGVEDNGLNKAQLDVLAQYGFVVDLPEPGEYNEFYQVYEKHRYDAQPIFVTTDSVFHVYHLIFDKMLRDLETGHFIPDLERLTSALLAATQQQYQTLKGGPLEEHARRNMAYVAVAARLLELPDATPPEAKDLVDAEVALINEHSGISVSPLWDHPDVIDELREDYSQYVPRGHYTRSDALKRYFRTMMWYGRMTFRMMDVFETRQALLMTYALRQAQTTDGQPAIDVWKQIYEPTVFIVGSSDDLSFQEYGVLADTVFGKNASPQILADDAQLQRFSQAAQGLPPPQINSMFVWINQDRDAVTKGFRLMGQRFTLDAYVLGQLVFRKVGTLDEPRNLPKGLDFFAALGSEEALNLLKDMGETRYENYDKQMAKVRQEISTLQQDSWTQNLYWSWLYAFQPVITPKDERYPAFMRTQAWTRKDLNTALGSWTELKHDTILYAKQIMAELGGGGEEEPPHGYVEPAPEVYARLLALCEMTSDGLQQRGLYDGTTPANLTNLMTELKFLLSVSERELNGEALSDDDYWHIQYFGGVLEQLTLVAADRDDESNRDLSDQKSPLIADVATGEHNELGMAALEEATGHPAPIYVVLPDRPWRVAVGAVYTYYEFPVKVADRMTDEAWQQMLAAGQAPPPPEWTQMFLVP